jgi:hypothetical protein
MSADFEQALLNVAAPRLKFLGYEYDPRLHVANEVCGFRKALGDDTYALIQFQQRVNAAQIEFTINLASARSAEIHPRIFGGYPAARGARLSYVLWFVHQLRDYAAPDYWWVISDGAHAPVVEEALDCLERYGVPWLEEPEVKKPWEMPLHHAGEFIEAARSIVAPGMERLGFQLKQQFLAGDQPYLYFSKELPGGLFGLIELQPIYSLDPQEFNFDVRLQCKPDGDPLSFSGTYHDWRSASLAQLVWQMHGGPALDTVNVDELKTLFWRYANRAELDAQLSDALVKIEQIGLPWLEQNGIASPVIQSLHLRKERRL